MISESRWYKSTYSVGDTNCVEVAESSNTVRIRDTQHRHLGHIEVPLAAWQVFVDAARRDEV